MKKLLLVFSFMVMTWVNMHAYSSYDFEAYNQDGIKIYYKIQNAYSDPYLSVVGCSPQKGEIVIPSTVTYNGDEYVVKGIGYESFYNCREMTAVTLPETLERIDYMAFAGCTGLTSITIPPKKITFGNNVFLGCTNLSRVDISDLSSWCINYFGASPSSNPLYYARNLYLNGELLTHVDIPTDISLIDWYAFYNCTSIRTIYIPDNIKSIGSYAFEGCENLTEVRVPESCEDIKSGCFSNCVNLKKVILPPALKHIQSAAFRGCVGLREINLPSSLEYISNHAFANCRSLCEVVIPDLVTTIDDFAFAGCESLTSFTLGKSVTKLGRCILANKNHSNGGNYSYEIEYDCGNLSDIKVKMEDPASVSLSYNTFDGQTNRPVTLFVPDKSIELYRNAEYWKDFASIDGYRTCEMPVVTVVDGKIRFECGTEGAEIHASMVSEVAALAPFSSGDEIEFPNIFLIQAYATAEGCDPSDVVTARVERIQSDADVNGDGVVDSRDLMYIILVMLDEE